MKKKNSYLFLFVFLFQILFSSFVVSQELKDELDSLEAPQEEDLSGLDDAAPAAPAPDESLPPDEELPPEDAPAPEKIEEPKREAKKKSTKRCKF